MCVCVWKSVTEYSYRGEGHMYVHKLGVSSCKEGSHNSSKALPFKKKKKKNLLFDTTALCAERVIYGQDFTTFHTVSGSSKLISDLKIVSVNLTDMP